VKVLLARVYGLLIGAITRLCALPFTKPLPTRWSFPPVCSTLASISQPFGERFDPVSVFLYVYGAERSS